MRLKKDGTKAINSKSKGSLFELKIAKRIAEQFDIPYGSGIRRTPGSGSLICRADIFIHATHRAKFNYFIELKKHQTIKFEHAHLDTWCIYKWFNEAKSKLPIDPEYLPDTPVMVIFSRNNWPVYCMTDRMLDDKYAKTKFTLCLTLKKKNTTMYVYLFEEFLSIYKELQEFWGPQLKLSTTLELKG